MATVLLRSALFPPARRTGSMRFPDLILPLKRLPRMLTSLSVRTRVVVLALVPVAGFLANGLTYLSGEGDVGIAFETVRQSTALSDASRDFKSAIAAMRIAVKDFSASPSSALVTNFEQAHTKALQSLDVISGSIDLRFAETIANLRHDVTEQRKNFNDLVHEQETLGFTAGH